MKDIDTKYILVTNGRLRKGVQVTYSCEVSDSHQSREVEIVISIHSDKSSTERLDITFEKIPRASFTRKVSLVASDLLDASDDETAELILGEMLRQVRFDFGVRRTCALWLHGMALKPLVDIGGDLTSFFSEMAKKK